MSMLIALLAIGRQDIAPKCMVKLMAPKVVAGTLVKAQIILTFADGLHAYQNPPTEDFQIPVKVSAGKGTVLKKVTYPAGKPFMMAGEDKPSMVYEGKIVIPVMIATAAKAGVAIIRLRVDYQQCNDMACFPPGSIDVVGKITIVKKKS